MNPVCGEGNPSESASRGDDADDLSLSGTELVDRISWLIALRWLAGAGVLATLVFTRFAFGSILPWFSLLVTTLCIPAYNLVFFLAWRRVKISGSCHARRTSAWLANAQIFCDLMALGVLIHYSGGVENPFAVYFIFHMVIASILLSPTAAFAQATVALSIFVFVAIGEYYGWLPHYTSPIGMQVPGIHHSALAVLAAIWVLATSLYITAYLATSITRRLRMREDQVVRLSRKTMVQVDSLQIAFDRLAETEKAKSWYTRKVAHELRSPLAAIDGLLRTVFEGLRGEISEESRSTIARARTRTRELLAMLGDLLALATATEAKRVSEWTDIDMAAMCDRVADTFALQPEDHGVKLNVEVGPNLPRVRGDREGIQEVLTNLVSNAVKYSPNGSTVNVRVLAGAGIVQIEVSDMGIGIDEADMNRIFEEFYRGGNAREFTSDGTGLGLSIVKRIVDAHGGTVQAQSSQGAGTAVTVCLPAQNGGS